MARLLLRYDQGADETNVFVVLLPRWLEPEGSRDRFAHRVGAGIEMGTQRGDHLYVAGRDEVANRKNWAV